jgi:large subunit ribosomal protein L18
MLREVKGTRTKIRLRIRGKITGTNERPRLSVFRSNQEIYGQIIDDIKGVTLVSASTLNIKDGNKKNKAYNLGLNLAHLAKEAKISKVVFDRGGYIYHGRVSELARGAREGGLDF